MFKSLCNIIDDLFMFICANSQRKDDGVFHAKPIKYKRSSESQREVDYDRGK